MLVAAEPLQAPSSPPAIRLPVHAPGTGRHSRLGGAPGPGPPPGLLPLLNLQAQVQALRWAGRVSSRSPYSGSSGVCLV